MILHYDPPQKKNQSQFLVHYLGTGNGTKLSKLLSESFIIDVVIQILDVHVDSQFSLFSLIRKKLTTYPILHTMNLLR